ncbi:TetR family transcriptional regulator, partial [Hungatella hathewayi]
MRLINEKLAADLLEAGKKEFLAHGFQGASLRDIAASLGVTTVFPKQKDIKKQPMFT